MHHWYPCVFCDSQKYMFLFAEWLGLRPSDLNKYDLPDQCRLDMTENDIKTGQELMKEEFILKNPEWVKELEIMVRYLDEASLITWCFWRNNSFTKCCR